MLLKILAKSRKNQMKPIFVAILILMLATTTIMIAVPAVSAKPTQQTWAYISLTPNPVGVGQPVHIRLFLQPFPPTGRDVFHNFQYTITKPDGTTEQRDGLTSDTNGAYDFDFTPTAIGSYTIAFSYPGEEFETAIDTGSSTTATLTVQQDPIVAIPDVELPTGYWTRPISEEFRSWSAISGNWLVQGYDASGRIYADTTGFNRFTQPILSPHIMWSKPMTMGGLIGGVYGPDGYYSGIQYNALATPPLIVNGRIYTRLYMSSSGEKGTQSGFACFDLRTGEEYWRNEAGDVNFAQVYNSKGYNGQGGVAMLYETSSNPWKIYDAFTGRLLYTVNGSQAMGNPDKIFYGPLGEVYAVRATGTTTPTVIMWNSTKAFDEWGFLSGGSFRGPGRSGTYDWSDGLEYNVTQPTTEPFRLSQTGPHNMPADAQTNTLFLIATPPETPNNGSSYETGVDALTGQTLWGPIRRDFDGTFTNRVATGEGVYVQLNAASLERIGISTTTGDKLWTSDPNLAPWGQYSGFGINAYGMSYQGSYSGELVALNLETGKKVWSFSHGNSGIETPYGSWPMFNGPVVGGGVVYAGYSEHTPNEPLYRGAKLFALDAYTGNKIWEIPAYLAVKALADGYLVTVNAYDNQMYVLGKGPSKTTVEGPDAAVPQGTSVMIKGTVTDQSEGAKDTPAISDSDMADWMTYLYMQKPMPQNAKGVTVKLTAVNQDGQAITIGEAVSDISGNYGYKWTPPSEGTWTITATFEGSNSYGSSFDQTYIAVDPAPTNNNNGTASIAGIDSTLIIGIAAVALIVAVIAIALALRKRA